jgi:hypothetical protein
MTGKNTSDDGLEVAGCMPSIAEPNWFNVGKATQSLRGRIGTHMKEQKKHFTHFSVFLVTGTNKTKTSQCRRIQDLEALILKILDPNKPKHNRQSANFAAAKKLTRSSPISLKDE